MEFKKNKWYNLGDVNPREHGGMFVKKDDTDIEVVMTYLDPDNESNYYIQSRSEDIKSLLSLYDDFKKNPDARIECNDVGRYADWARFIKEENTAESKEEFYNNLVFYLASDMISYYGGDCEPECDSNYWEMLGFYGITNRNFT